MSIHQHYRKDEHRFVDQILEWLQTVKDTYSYKRSGFLDPREQEIAAQLVAYDGETNVFFCGGGPQVERKRAIFAPDYFNPQTEDFDLVCFEVNYPDKFVTVTHRNLLGSLMSLGLKREKFGDILIRGKTVQFVASRDISDYLLTNVQAVGKTSVSLREVPLADLIVPDEQWKEFSETFSSLRLDVVIAEMFRLSRANAVSYIQAGNVKVNWRVIESPAYACHVHDTISVKGYGRGKLLDVQGKTKKGKWRVQYGIKQ